MKLGSFPMQILAVLFLQQPLLSGWNGPFLLVLNLRELRLGGSKLRAQDLNGGSASPTSPDPRSWNLPAEELFLWGDLACFLESSLFSPLLEVVPAAKVELQLVRILSSLL